MTSTITMPDIARLADVTRQAVTNWRSRSSAPPFPIAVTSRDGIEHFDRDEVVDWLEATGRGQNPDARLDAPAIASPKDHDLGSAVVLLALRAAIAEDLGHDIEDVYAQPHTARPTRWSACTPPAPLAGCAV